MSGWVGGHLCQGGSSGFHINTRPLHGIYLRGEGSIQEPTEVATGTVFGGRTS